MGAVFIFSRGQKIFYKTRKISFLNHGKREKGNEETTEAKKARRGKPTRFMFPTRPVGSRALRIFIADYLPT